MGKRKGRAAKRRTAARRQDGGPSQAMPDPITRAAVVDSDASDGSSVDSAEADYITSVYGASAPQGEGGGLLDIEELFPSLGNVDLGYGLLGHSSSDLCTSSSSDGSFVDCQEEGGSTVLAWYAQHSFSSLKSNELEKAAAIDCLEPMVRFVVETAPGNFERHASLTVENIQLCIAVFEVAQAFCLQACLTPPDIAVAARHGHVRFNRDMGKESVVVGFGEARKTVETIVSSVYENRCPAVAWPPNSREANVRSVVEQLFRLLAGEPSPGMNGSLRFDQKDDLTWSVLSKLGHILSTNVVFRGENGTVEMPRCGDRVAEVHRTFIANVLESVVQFVVWDDMTGLSLCDRTLMRSVPARIGTDESLARSVVCRVFNTWADESMPRVDEPLLYSVPGAWKGLLVGGLEGSFGIRCAATEGRHEISVRFPSSPPLEREIRVLGAHVHSLFDFAAREPKPRMLPRSRAASAYSGVQAGSSVQPKRARMNAEKFENDMNDKKGGKKGKKGKNEKKGKNGKKERKGQKGKNRLRGEYSSLLNELIEFLAASPPTKDSIALSSGRREFNACFAHIANQWGYPSKSSKSERGAHIFICNGLDGHAAPSLRDMAAAGWQVFDSQILKKKKRQPTGQPTWQVQPCILEAAPLDERNRGFQILAGMGHDSSIGLGAANQGIVEPVKVEMAVGRRGLG